MKDLTLPQLSFIVCNFAGFGLLGAYWLYSGDTMGFFLILFLITMVLFRWRYPRFSASVVLESAVCAMGTFYFPHIFPYALVLTMFGAMYYRKYWALLALMVIFVDVYAGTITILGGLTGYFLGQWALEREQGLKGRDAEAGRYYELEALQQDLLSATQQIERMTKVSERARIAREIHDNAGHEIVAAYISLQTARDILESELGMSGGESDVLLLYDAALERLDSGANRMREAVHNLAPVAALGVEALQETCRRFPSINVDFKAYGDTAHVPVHIWRVLEAILNEALTNAIRHAKPRNITVNLDTTRHIVRLFVENDGVTSSKKHKMGHGLRNLRHRIASVGGSLAVDAGEMFHITCVIPLKGIYK